MPSTGMARTTLPARSKKTAKGLGPSGIGVRTTVGAGGLALDLEFAAELAGAAAGAAGAEVAPSAFSFSVTELLMASTSALNFRSHPMRRDAWKYCETRLRRSRALPT